MRQLKECLPPTNSKQITWKNPHWLANNSSIDEKLRPEQAGFRKGRGTTEQICILRNITEQSVELQASLYVNFVDFQKPLTVLSEKEFGK